MMLIILQIRTSEVVAGQDDDDVVVVAPHPNLVLPADCALAMPAPVVSCAT